MVFLKIFRDFMIFLHFAVDSTPDSRRRIPRSRKPRCDEYLPLRSTRKVNILIELTLN